MTYTETKNAIQKIRNKDEMIFRCAISHMLDVGARHLTEENVNETIAEIMQEDDSRSFMTNECKAAILRTAYELTKFDHIHLIVYIQREVDGDVFDGGICYGRAIQLLKNLMDIVELGHDNNEYTKADFRDAGFKTVELEHLGFDYLTPTEDCGYNGQVINCPECGAELAIEDDAARCPECGWMVADAELEEMMEE